MIFRARRSNEHPSDAFVCIWFRYGPDVARAHMKIKLKARRLASSDKLAEGACRRSTAVHLNNCGRWSRVLSSPQSKDQETDDRDVGGKHYRPDYGRPVQ